MGRPRQSPDPALLFCGALFSDPGAYLKARGGLVKNFGPVFMETESYKWHSSYYEEELGSPVLRSFIFFEDLISPEDIADIKLLTNGMEEELAENGRRTVNLDPGYIALSKIVLASTKEYGHRIYLKKGVYAEVTMLYSRSANDFRPHEYTYRDFSDGKNREAFLAARDFLKTKTLSLKDFEKSPE